MLASLRKLPKAQLDQFTTLWSQQAGAVSVESKHNAIGQVVKVIFGCASFVDVAVIDPAIVFIIS